jgi:acyl-CoA synthetase (AMP-forming)/AMP-acid ligase II
VGILLENGPEYVGYYYGALAAGAVAVPLNTAAKANELAAQLRHSGATHLVSASHPETDAIMGVLPAICLINDLEGVADCESPGVALDPGLPASIIYTSGTTGRPKGVTLSHNNLVANVQSILAYLGLGQDDVLVNILPFSYSYGNSVLHTHLAAGARLVLDRSLVYPQAVLDAMESESATGFSGVSSSYTLLMARANWQDYDLSSLRYFTQAGGAMTPSSIERVRSAVPHAKFFVMYGQTEATARLAYLPPERVEKKRGSIGIPIPGVEISLRNEFGREVSRGETGEIWARGANIMLGYWSDPEATKGALSDGWLKTGDLAHQVEEGDLFIDGRSSEMIKSGAYRISPQEIEEVIADIPQVLEVAVTGVSDELLGQVVKAVVVPRSGETVDRLSVQRHCRERLPAYKVPRLVEFAESLPRTASGKVKRFLLADNRKTKGDRDVVSNTGS